MKSWMTIAVTALALSCSAANVTMTKVGEYSFAVDGCGGITYRGGSASSGYDFYVLRDHNDSTGKAQVYPLTLTINSLTGAITYQDVGTPFSPGNLNDSEGIAYDPGRGTFWVSDEASPSITEFLPVGTATGKSAPIPDIQSTKKRSNRSLESLTISGDGLTMWTANEQALDGDGPLSDGTDNVQTIVRLTKFTRVTVKSNWQHVGQWAYRCDKCGGSESSQSGVSDLCALPDGSLLVLEREVSVSTGGRCRIYRVTPEAIAAATDVANIPALSEATYNLVSVDKALINFEEGSVGLGENDMINYEGICLGPRLSDGSLAVYLVSDGGAVKKKEVLFITVTATVRSRLCACKLSGLDVRTVNFEAPSQGEASITGSNFRYLKDATIVNTLSGVESQSEPAWGKYAAKGDQLSWTSVNWYVNGTQVSSGTGNTASFTVDSDCTMSWGIETQTKEKTSSQIFASDSFEQPAAGTDVGDLAGWSGDGTVRALAYTPPTPPGYTMADETHSKVLEVDDTARRTYNTSDGDSRLDMMVCVSAAAEELPSPDADVQIAVAADPQGRLCVYHTVKEGNMWIPRWTPLSDKVWPSESWVRIEFLNDYTSSHNGRAYCQIRVNGSLCPTQYGVRDPNDPIPYGSWYAMIGGGAAGKVSSVTFEGSTKVDDVLFTETERTPEHKGATSADGIAFSWFDEKGLARDPTAPAPFIKGYTLSDVYYSGVDPYGDEPLKIKNIRIGANGKIELDINAIRPNPETVYCVFRTTDLKDLNSADDVAGGAHNFKKDTSDYITTWTDEDGNLPNAFYWIKAVRQK